MKKFSVFLAAAAFGALPFNAAAFGGRAAMAMGHPGVALHRSNQSAFRPGFRRDSFAFQREGRLRSGAFFHQGRFFRHHRFFRSDVALFGLGYPYDLDYPYYYYPGDDYGDADADASASDLAASVQIELTRLGYYRGPIDGQLGPSTRQAIKAFQVAKGLPAFGYIDPKFLKALERG